jgi:1-phosphatidylinositol phosphodiesterase
MQNSLSDIGNKWMSFLNDDMKISEITIPGTHNTCATKSLAKCQHLSLINQLNSGVRYIDIRCRHIEDRFLLHHGQFCLDKHFDKDVVHVCVEFLKNNPTESIIMLASPEHLPKNNKLKFDEVFFDYVMQHPEHWFLEEHLPTLRECRGKIVLFRRFKSLKKPFGIDMSGWQASKTFEIKNHADFGFLIQDKYDLRAHLKWESVKEIFQLTNCSRNDQKKTCYMCYCSSQKWPIQPPIVIAWIINQNLEKYLAEIHDNKNEKVLNQLGIVVLDFAYESIISSLFRLNFFKY